MSHKWQNTECSLCRLVRRPEHLIGRHCGISRQTEGLHSVITWSVSQSVLRHRVLYKFLLCSVLCFMTRVSQCPINPPSEHPVLCHLTYTLSHFAKMRQPVNSGSQQSMRYTTYQPNSTTCQFQMETVRYRYYSILNFTVARNFIVLFLLIQHLAQSHFAG
jgi:hypothetical protein